MGVSFSSPVLVADAADARRHESQESSSNNRISLAAPACAAASAVVARPRSAGVCWPSATATTASASTTTTASASTSPGASSFELAIFRRAAAWPLGWLGCHPKTDSLPLHCFLHPWVVILQLRGTPLLHFACLSLQNICFVDISFHLDNRSKYSSCECFSPELWQRIAPRSTKEKFPLFSWLKLAEIIFGACNYNFTFDWDGLYLYSASWSKDQELIVRPVYPLANPHGLPCERLSWLPDDCLALSLAPLYQGVNFLWEFRILWNPGGYEQGKMRNDWKTFIVFLPLYSILNTHVLWFTSLHALSTLYSYNIQ